MYTFQTMFKSFGIGYGLQNDFFLILNNLNFSGLLNSLIRNNAHVVK